MILWDNSYVYATDPNKNVRVKRFPDEWMGSGWIEEFFDYKPFGELRHYVQYPPRFMFSSEEYMPETGMYHYLYRAYSPSLARFITRDPIEEQGGVNLYCFVGNNPISYWDILGFIGYRQALKQEWHRQLDEVPLYERWLVAFWESAWLNTLSLEAKFNIWYEADKAEGTAWLNNLPNCPDCIKIGADGKPEKCTNGQWSEITPADQKYHPGAKWAMRSNELWGLDIGFQQQCTYDKDGFLIKSGPIAGTPDKSAGNVLSGVIFGLSYYKQWIDDNFYTHFALPYEHLIYGAQHYDQDVKPYKVARELDGLRKDEKAEEIMKKFNDPYGLPHLKKYLELRLPNQGGGSCYD